MDIFMMGKYSVHVWSSFAITAVVIGVCALQARRMHNSVLRNLKTRIRAMESER